MCNEDPVRCEDPTGCDLDAAHNELHFLSKLFAALWMTVFSAAQNISATQGVRSEVFTSVLADLD
jgi:hypothetical protein